jgi:hypothetical protein
VNNELDSGWVAVLDTESELLLATEGRPPGAEWLADALGPKRGAQTQTQGDSSVRTINEDLIWVVLARFDAVLAAGRPGWPFSDHERDKLDAMSRLADARWSELGSKATRGTTSGNRLTRP